VLRTEGEGCFYIRISKYNAYTTGSQVQLKFKLTQHTRDEKLLRSLVDYLDCGEYYISKGLDWGDFFVARFSDMNEKIIPFFDKYPLVGCKRQDYLDFVKVAKLMNEKAHLTQEGLEQIRVIKSGMNKGRK
jgi:hypothetical protein